jgi:UDP-glucose 4-epimerase
LCYPSDHVRETIIKIVEKLLVTGASGLLGFELTQQLSNNYEVFKLVKTYNQDLGENQILHNFLDEFDETILPKKMDYIFHLAQFRDFKNFPENSSEIFKVNTFSTLGLINYGLKSGVKKFVYTSTGGLYKGLSLPISETDIIKKPEELDFYCASKLSSELLISSYSKFLDVQILRPFFIFGPRQSDQMLVPRIIRNIRNKELIHLAGEQGININPIYVKDAVSILIRLLQVPGSNLYNIAGNEVVSISKLALAISEIIRQTPEFIHQPSQMDLVGDNKLVKDTLGDISWTDLKKSLTETIHLKALIKN